MPKARSQPDTNMAHALETRGGVPHPHRASCSHGELWQDIRTASSERAIKASIRSRRNGTVTMPIRWAMGASSAMGQTYILEKDGELYESRMSWFRELNGLGPTLGGGNSLPADLREAAGRLMSHDDKLRCFGCHATNAAEGNRTHAGQDDSRSALRTLSRGYGGARCGNGAQQRTTRGAARLDQPAKSVGGTDVQLLRPVSPDLGGNRDAGETRASPTCVFSRIV